MKELQVQDYITVLPRIQSADINTLFALSVLEGKVKGKVYVDNEKEPAFIYIVNPYGMALLYGDKQYKTDWYEQLIPYLLNSDNHRRTPEWLQVYPVSLASGIEGMLEENFIKMDPEERYQKPDSETSKKIIGYQRINYGFHKDSFYALKNRQTHKNFHVIRTTEAIYNNLSGSVVPKYFWNNYDDFNTNGVGFTVISEEGLPLATAFAAFIIGDQLEIGIETNADNRGLGFATAVCMELIDYCISKGFEPVWSCHSGNLGSRRLAEKLGFHEVKRIPYYCLPIVIE
jgi:GNAT superfamily N-acetyltransferase